MSGLEYFWKKNVGKTRHNSTLFFLVLFIKAVIIMKGKKISISWYS